MGLTKPDAPEFDIEQWRTLGAHERLRWMCVTWATQGFGAPDVVYVLYLTKIVAYVGGFLAFAALTPSLGGPLSIDTWWSQPAAFQKAVLWTMLFEVLGLGCGSGPLTGHYGPLFPAVRHWLRVGTIRLRPFRWVPLTAGHRRNVIDVALYAATLALLVAALMSDTVGRAQIGPIVVVMVLLGLRDKTILLAARFEHYLVTAAIFMFPADLWSGSKALQLMLWLGAATSKLTHHFPSVMAIMQSNSPVFRSRRARERLWRHYPTDLRTSRRADLMAHGATVIEFAFPLVLAFAPAGPWRGAALALMVLFHLGIFTSIPMGVPLEWNVFFIYSGLVLFGAHGDERFWQIDSPWVVAGLLALLVIGPLWGNFAPDKISFLPAMRYYAGNWAASAWLFAPGALERLDTSIVKTAPLHRVQLEGNIEPGTYDITMARGHAFRSMHLHGRALAQLIPRAAAPLALDSYEQIDGEMVAGLVLGWNFGDGHLHHEQLMAALQAECDFAPGDVRAVFVESQPLHRQRLHWRICDSAAGQLGSGHVTVADLRGRQPWGELAADP